MHVCVCHVPALSTAVCKTLSKYGYACMLPDLVAPAKLMFLLFFCMECHVVHVLDSHFVFDYHCTHVPVV